MQGKEILVKAIFFISGIIALALFVVVRHEALYYKLTTSDMKYGDLYEMTNIEDFRILKKEIVFPDSIRWTSNYKSIHTTNLLLFGDSFFNSENKAFITLLTDTLKQWGYFSLSPYPLLNLKSIYKDTSKQKTTRILIYEIVERNIWLSFGQKHELPGQFSKKKISKIVINFFDDAFKPLKNTVFPEAMETKYKYFLDRSILTSSISKWLNTFRFRNFGYISQNTPKYSLNPPMLFYYQTVNNKKTSFYYPYSQEEIKLYCDNIEDLYNKLKNHYNIEMILMPIPNKYTIYSHLINNDAYNGLLDKIQEELTNRKIPFVDVYHTFKSSKTLVYHPSDTHWNYNGMKLVLNEAIKKLKEIKTKNPCFIRDSIELR